MQATSRRLGTLFFLLSLLVSQPALAQSADWKFDKAHCNFYFDVRHVYSTIRGFFPDYSGTFHFDPAHPEQAKMHLEIKVGSVQTAVGQRDTHLLSDTFFSAAKYPLITFDSTSFTKSGDNQYTVSGKLTIKDVSQEISLPLTFLGEKDHPLVPGTVVAGFEGRLTIDRLAFHVGDGSFYKMGAIGKEVNILVSLELLRDK